MTQIVWDGRFLVADRKCFRNTSVFQAQKLRVHHVWEKSTAFAFAGTYEECHIADQIMVAKDNTELVEYAKSILSDPAASWQGLCIEKYNREAPKLYLCNYLGMREEMPFNTPFAVGACADEILFALCTWRAVAKNMDVPAHYLFLPKEERTLDEFKLVKRQAQALVNFIRTVLKGTYYDQEDGLFDIYDSITGEVLCL